MNCESAAEDYITVLEDRAGRDMYDPSKYTFQQNKQYLDTLVSQSKEKAQNKQYDDAYVGFRRFQILLSILQQRNLFSNDDSLIIKYNEVILHFQP